jgi:hypothetical protein
MAKERAEILQNEADVSSTAAQLLLLHPGSVSFFERGAATGLPDLIKGTL